MMHTFKSFFQQQQDDAAMWRKYAEEKTKAAGPKPINQPSSVVVKNDHVFIQVQKESGIWVPVGSVSSNPTVYTKFVENLKKQYVGKRFRVLDHMNRVIDIFQ